MTKPSPQPKFSLAELQDCALRMLKTQLDPIPQYCLLKDVLRLPADHPALTQAKISAMNTDWMRQLVQAQWEDGSWGRFHSQDTKSRSVFHSTEEAIDRAMAIGIEPGDEIMVRARHYIINALQGRVQITDPPEKNERWPLLVQTILTGRLAQLDPGHALIKPVWSDWLQIARQAFSSGNYSTMEEASAIHLATGIYAPQGYLESQHALWLLAAQELPASLEYLLVEWIWTKPDGIRYLRVSLANPQPRQMGYWLRSLNILSRFPSWREISLNRLNQLWEQRGEDGLWDFGSDTTLCVDFPLSESWRKISSRKIDYSSCVLAVLRKYYD